MMKKKTDDLQIEIKLKLTYKDIIKLTATSRQMVTTVLNDLEKKNLVSYDRNEILIKNINDFWFFTFIKKV